MKILNLVLIYSSLSFASSSIHLDQGNIEFIAIGKPTALKIHGKGEAAKGTLKLEGNALSGKLDFDLDSLDTGLKLRNEHMKKKYLETDKFKQASLTLYPLKLPDSFKVSDAKQENIPFQGTLLLHGVLKTMNGLALIEKSSGKLSIRSTFGLKLTDYSIAIPSFAGVTVAEDVDVLVQLAGTITN